MGVLGRDEEVDEEEGESEAESIWFFDLFLVFCCFLVLGLLFKCMTPKTPATAFSSSSSSSVSESAGVKLKMEGSMTSGLPVSKVKESRSKVSRDSMERVATKDDSVEQGQEEFSGVGRCVDNS